MSQPEGIDLAKRLAALSDVVIDNMRPDAMIKMGLGYEVLKNIKPDLIVISSSGRGQEGPETEYLGFATIPQRIGGLTYMSGYPDGHPTLRYGRRCGSDECHRYGLFSAGRPLSRPDAVLELRPALPEPEG